jgi:4-amino-4-deoxy-L-arabinose transferase-like glycosyltransferase
MRSAIAAGTFAVFLLTGLGMSARKAPWCDEGWFGSAAYHFARYTRLVIPEIEPVPDDPKMMHSAEHIFWNVPLYEVWEGAAARLFGFSLFEARVSSLVWGALALAAWALVVRQVAGGAAALLTLLLLAVDHIFLVKATDVRMDTMSAALEAIALLLYLSYRQRNLSLAILLSQTCVTLSFLTHPNGGILAFLDTAVLALYYDRAQLRPRHALAAAAPYLAGALGWGIYLMQDFALARVQFGGNAAGRFDGVRAPLTALRNEILRRYFYAFGGGPDGKGLARLKLLLLAGYAIGAVGTLTTARRLKGLRIFLILAAIHCSFLTFFDTTKSGSYLVYIIPLLAILLAVWISALWQTSPSWARPILATGVVGFALLQLGATANTILQNRSQRDYLAAASYLKQHAAPEDLIVGPAEMGFELGFERPISDDQRLGYYSRKQPRFIVVNANYRGWFETFRSARPAIYAHIRAMLESYRPVFQEGDFEIYERPANRALVFGQLVAATA